MSGKYNFLKDCINLDELKIQCHLFGFKIHDVVQDICFFREDGNVCIGLDHLYWFDNAGNEIQAPKSIRRSIMNFPIGITSLEGCPEKVNGDFFCVDCGKLKSLNGGPKFVGEEFSCVGCSGLTTLEGAPEYVGTQFYCNACTSLINLKGAPNNIYGDFDCSGCRSLKTLTGAPESVKGYFYCSMCASLVTLDGAPGKVQDAFFIGNKMLSNKQIADYLRWVNKPNNKNYREQ